MAPCPELLSPIVCFFILGRQPQQESDRKKQRDIAAKSNQRQRDINIQSDVTTKEEGNTTLFCVGKATARRILFFFS